MRQDRFWSSYSSRKPDDNERTKWLQGTAAKRKKDTQKSEQKSAEIEARQWHEGRDSGFDDNWLIEITATFRMVDSSEATVESVIIGCTPAMGNHMPCRELRGGDKNVIVPRS